MSYDHRTIGQENFSLVMQTLDEIGARYELLDSFMYRGLRLVAADGTPKICEEYLKIEDTDCDGTSVVAVAFYDEGARPELTTAVARYDDMDDDAALGFDPDIDAPPGEDEDGDPADTQSAKTITLARL